MVASWRVFIHFRCSCTTYLRIFVCCTKWESVHLLYLVFCDYRLMNSTCHLFSRRPRWWYRLLAGCWFRSSFSVSWWSSPLPVHLQTHVHDYQFRRHIARYALENASACEAFQSWPRETGCFAPMMNVGSITRSICSLFVVYLSGLFRRIEGMSTVRMLQDAWFHRVEFCASFLKTVIPRSMKEMHLCGLKRMSMNMTSCLPIVYQKMF